MKPVLFFALLFLVACNKDNTKSEAKSVGVVNYTIQDSVIQITDTTVGDKAIWIRTNDISKGYGLEAYNSVPGGEIHDMITLFIKTDQLKTGINYSEEVTGTILRNSYDNAATKQLPGTYIRVNISELSGNKVSGTFTAYLKNLSTNEYFNVKGDFKNVTLKTE